MNNPHLITSDAAGNIWYSEGFSGYIGKFIPKTGAHQNINVSKGISGTHISGLFENHEAVSIQRIL
jgi:streptogramin lyase